MRLGSRLISCVMVASYMLVATAGSSLHHHSHTHGHCGSGCASPVVKTTCSHGCTHSHSHQHAKNSQRPAHHHHDGHGPHHDDNCFVCQVLAQKPLSTPRVAVVELIGRVYTAALAPIVQPALVVVDLPLTRGPPIV